MTQQALAEKVGVPREVVANLEAGKIEPQADLSDGWTVDPNAFTVGAHQIDRAGVVTVDGVMYPTSHPSKSLALNHAYNFSMVSVGIPAGHRAVTVAGYITFGVPQVDSSSRLFDYVGIWGGVTGGYTVLQLMVQAPIVFFLCWLFAQSITFIPPMK